MVSVSLPGGNYYIFMAISLVCLSTLLTWVVWLAIAPPWRLWLRDNWRLGSALMALLAVAGGIFPCDQTTLWLAAQRHAREARAHRDILDSARTIAGIAMPAGTTLQLGRPGQPDSFVQAGFPQAVEVEGLKVLHIRRYVRPADAKEPARETWSVQLAADQAVQGWTCSHRLSVDLVVAGGTPHFEDCGLAEGNKLDGQPLPMGTWLTRSQDKQRWRLSIGGSEAATIHHLPLLMADVVVDGQGRIVSFKGLLARQIELGDMTYPTGTRAATARNVPGAKPGDLLFSPPRGRAAHRKDHPDVDSGSSVLQAPGGAVRLVLDNRQAGVLDVATIRIGP